MAGDIEVRGEKNARREMVLNKKATGLVAELQGELGPDENNYSTAGGNDRPSWPRAPDQSSPRVRRRSGAAHGTSRRRRQICAKGGWKSPALLTPR